MAPPLLLLGPPSIHHRPASAGGACLNQPPPILPSKNNNSSSIFLPPQNPCLDLFFCNPPGMLPNLTKFLEKAYTHDPLITLKLICNLRDEKSGGGAFFAALLWLHQHHPITLACNIRSFATFGCLKELPKILHGVVECQRESKVEKSKKKTRIIEERGGVKDEKRALKKAKDIGRAKRAVEMYRCDTTYRFLHNQISKLFADLLESDLQFLSAGEIDKISMASKWCPSLDSSLDKSTLICEGIARNLFPRQSDAAYKDIEEAHYAFRVRDRLRKQVLIPLRKALDGTNSIATKKRILKKDEEKILRVYQNTYQMLFTKDDDERFRVYLDMADRFSEVRMPYLPHQIVASLKDGHGGELQWRRLVEFLSRKGKLNNCLAVCNISEGMKGTPMEDFSIAMGLLISELNQDPWKGNVFTYSADPKLRKIQGNTLGSKVEFMRGLKCDGNIFFSKVFDQVLQLAVANNLNQDKMVERIFVFTDMGFERASNNFWAAWASLTKYQSRGYKALPEIVFWNLREPLAIPVVQKHKGLVMIKGFSKSCVAMLLERGVVATPVDVAASFPKPEDIMKLAIFREEYRDLCVFD